jgi:alpha-glucosidase (family GH31 glycosyl hydrolase)
MERFIIKCNPAPKEKTIVGDGYRLSVLSSTVLRVELSKNNQFEDRPSQTVFCRDFSDVEFKLTETPQKIIIETDCTIFYFSKKFKTVSCEAKEYPKEGENNPERRTYKLTKRGNLGGTTRTLDFRIGKVNLGKGLMSRGGLTVFDDSKTFVIDEDGTLVRRLEGTKDFYVFAFDRYYADGLADFYKLTGNPPILPKYALGNWWSRYYPYSETTYLELMDKFAAKKVPLTVATVDMDWHWVKEVPKEYATGWMGLAWNTPGWTGYSWNTGLFPEYKRFLSELKKRGLAVTLNVHPAQGVRAFEDMYEEMAKAVGIDPATKQPVKFDLLNPKFLDAYFKILHHPYEADGVDFWWIDWQQGKKSAVKGLDPLWLLNHYHTLDINRGGKKGIILSRYSKLGSHRYPIGFSGDYTTAWKSLKFQPYMTATATNVGYTWWSHDIGGHQFGRGDDELYLRWVQSGVFSPINRLHSTKGAFASKEPWVYRRDVEEYAISILRFRHKMLPYLYTANVLTATAAEPLISPMYYNLTVSDNVKQAYKSKASFFFGSQLVVAPIATKIKKNFNRSGVKFYLPTGEWTDIFTGQKYIGGKMVKLYRKLDGIPVLAKAGAIIPLLEDDTTNSLSFKNLEVWAYQGFGSYTLYDENGASLSFESELSSKGYTLTVSAPAGKLATKSINIIFKDIANADIKLDGEKSGKGNSVKIVPDTEHKITLTNIKTEDRSNYLADVEDVLQDYHIFIPVRVYMFYRIRKKKNREEAAKLVKRMPLRRDVKGALLEVLSVVK